MSHAKTLRREESKRFNTEGPEVTENVQMGKTSEDQEGNYDLFSSVSSVPSVVGCSFASSRLRVKN
jgi:hypothetical protein